MAPRIRSNASSRRAAGKAAPSKRASKPAREPCSDCGQPCARGAGLAAHRRAKHRPLPPDPPAPVTADEAEPSARVVPIAPDGVVAAGRALWDSVVKVYDLRPD